MLRCPSAKMVCFPPQVDAHADFWAACRMFSPNAAKKMFGNGKALSLAELNDRLPKQLAVSAEEYEEYARLVKDIVGKVLPSDFFSAYTGSKSFAEKAKEVLAITPASTCCDSLFSVAGNLPAAADAVSQSTALLHVANGDVLGLYGGDLPRGFPRHTSNIVPVPEVPDGVKLRCVGYTAARDRISKWHRGKMS